MCKKLWIIQYDKVMIHSTAYMRFLKLALSISVQEWKAILVHFLNQVLLQYYVLQFE